MKIILSKKRLLSQYNKLVKKEYKTSRGDLLQEEAKQNAYNNGVRAYVEIPSYMTKDGITHVID